MAGRAFRVAGTLVVMAGLSSLPTGGVAVRAHHSLAGIYDEARRVTLEGVITQFEFRNPHPIIVMEVRDGDGRAQRWLMEMDSRRELLQVGVGERTLKPGDHIVVLGSRARRQPHSLYVRRIDRPSDGFTYEHQ
jgi:hypothetical protein